MSLSQILAERKANNSKKIPADKWAVMENSTNALKEASLSSKAIKTGETLPEFNLPDATGNSVALSSFTNDFLILTFYRGGWCPFCNMELRALQEVLPELKSLKADLVAISPETPDNSLTTSEKNELTFSVLSDAGNLYAKELGLVFQMPEDLREVYNSFNLKVDEHNGNNDYELPMPATYIVNKQREVIYGFTPEDYTERLDPETILEVLKKNI